MPLSKAPDSAVAADSTAAAKAPAAGESASGSTRAATKGSREALAIGLSVAGVVVLLLLLLAAATFAGLRWRRHRRGANDTVSETHRDFSGARAESLSSARPWSLILGAVRCCNISVTASEQ